MELNKIKETVSKKINLTETEEEKNRRYKAMPRKFVDWFLSCLKELGVERGNIKDAKSLVGFYNFSGSLYNLVYKIEMASEEDFNCINLFIKEVEGLYKKIADFKPGINAYLKLNSRSCEESINKIKVYWHTVKKNFVYDENKDEAFSYDVVVSFAKSMNHDYENIIKGFVSIIELMIYNKLEKESLNKIDKFIKILALDNKYYCCFLKALHSFIDELCKTEKRVKLIDLIDILPDAIKEIKSSIKIFNLVEVDNGMKKSTGVFKSDRKFYMRYINIALLKSVLSAFEKNINKLFNANEIILKSIKQMLIIILETRISKEYLSKILGGDDITKRVLSRIFYSLIKNETIDKSFSLRYICSCCKTSETKKPELYDFNQNDFCK